MRRSGEPYLPSLELVEVYAAGSGGRSELSRPSSQSVEGVLSRPSCPGGSQASPLWTRFDRQLGLPSPYCRTAGLTSMLASVDRHPFSTSRAPELVQGSILHAPTSHKGERGAQSSKRPGSTAHAEAGAAEGPPETRRRGDGATGKRRAPRRGTGIVPKGLVSGIAIPSHGLPGLPIPVAHLRVCNARCLPQQLVPTRLRHVEVLEAERRGRGIEFHLASSRQCTGSARKQTRS